MDLTEVANSFPALVQGAVTTIALSAVGIVLATAGGVIVGLMRTSSMRGVRLATRVYVDALRGSPLLIQMFLIYYGLPSVGITLSSFDSAAIALAMNSTAYQAEIVRAAISAVPKGQVEAARALGMPRSRIALRIVAPQAAAIAMPAIANEWVDIIKWSSVASIVVVSEVTLTITTLIGLSFSFSLFVTLFSLVTVFYYVLTSLVTWAARRVEKHLLRYREISAL